MSAALVVPASRQTAVTKLGMSTSLPITAICACLLKLLPAMAAVDSNISDAVHSHHALPAKATVMISDTELLEQSSPAALLSC
jgi:hypothetical protein